MKRTQLILNICFSLFVFSGCSGMPVVKYSPMLQASGPKDASVWVKEFKDERSPYEREILGGVYNAYNMRLGDVQTPAGLVQSIRDALVSELKNAGYQIIDSGKDISIQGTIQSILCDSKRTRSCEAQIQLVVTDKGEEVLSQSYRGESRQLVSFSVDCSQPLNKSIEQIVVQFVKDLNKYLKT